MRFAINKEPSVHSRSLIQNSGIAMAGRILGRGFGYVAQILLARGLAPEGYGLFAIGWTFLRLFSIAGHLGLDYGVTKFGTRYWGKDQAKVRNLIIVAVGSAFISGSIFGLILTFSSPWLANIVFKKSELEPILKGIAIAFPFATTLRVLAATTTIQGKTIFGAVSEDITQPFVQMTLFILFLRISDGMNAAIASTIISYAVATIVGFFFVSYLIPNLFSFTAFATDDLLSLFKFSLPAIAGATLGAFNLWGDRLLMGYFGTKSDTGIYQSISLITMLTTIVLSGIKISAAPIFSRMFSDNRLSEIREISKSISRWSLYITMPILLFVIFQASNVITAFFGSDYQVGAVPLIILTIGQFFYILFGIIDQVLLMTGKQKEWLVISATVFLLTVYFDALLIPKYHLIGASFVSSTMMLLLGILSMVYLKHHMQFWLLDASHYKILATTLFTGLITYPFIANLPFSTIANTVISFFITIILFAILLFLYGMDRRDKIQLLMIINKGKAKSA